LGHSDFPGRDPASQTYSARRREPSRAKERKYKKVKEEIIGEVRSLRLNQARIDALVEQLYDINKRLVGYEGRLMRLAESHGRDHAHDSTAATQKSLGFLRDSEF
jgi:Sigma-70, non-essential region